MEKLQGDDFDRDPVDKAKIEIGRSEHGVSEAQDKPLVDVSTCEDLEEERGSAFDLSGFDPQALPVAVSADHWAISRAMERIECLKNALVQIGPSMGIDYAQDIRVILSGSMMTGHFTGPKPKCHSMNPAAPHDRVIESDLRIIFPEHVDPHNGQALELVIAALKTFGPVAEESLQLKIRRWEREIQMTLFFQYETIEDTEPVVFEWEICLNQEPYFEIADFWQAIFSAEEISKQVRLREVLRAVRAPLASEFNPTKMLHCQECRWRILASYALDLLARESMVKIPHSILEQLPLRGDAPPAIKWLVPLWLAGETQLVVTNRPTRTLAEAAETRLMSLATSYEQQAPDVAAFLRESVDLGPAPSWTEFALRVQKVLQEARNKLDEECEQFEQHSN
jgi:hypothetical protein